MSKHRRGGIPPAFVVVAGIALGAISFVAFGPSPTTPAVAAPRNDTVASAPPPSVTFATSTTLPPITTTSRAVTETSAPPRGELVIQGVGDVNFDPTYITAFMEVGYEAAFEGLDGILLEDDLTVINLECPATDLGTQAAKEYSFACDPAALPIAAANGVEVANLANNHGQDRGVEGMLDSVVQLESAGIEPVGVGADVAAATRPAIVEIDGWRVAVLGMGGVVPGESWLAGEDHPGMASGDDIDQMVAAVEAASRQADLVVVSIHWGRELVTEPDADDRARAEAMVAAGADIVFGHHPHRLGELEFIDGAPVFWTLGNFIWPRLSDAGATTAVARVTVAPDGEVDACLVPVFIQESGRPVLVDGSECPDA